MKSTDDSLHVVCLYSSIIFVITYNMKIISLVITRHIDHTFCMLERSEAQQMQPAHSVVSYQHDTYKDI
jgi:hypothetical protein